jgi:hypothetical protein
LLLAANTPETASFAAIDDGVNTGEAAQGGLRRQPETTLAA